MRRLAAIPGVVLIAVAAALWGTDPIIRKSMSFTTSATTIVFGEHVILVLCTLPFLLPALRAVFRAGPRYVAAAVVVGAGASAVATILFTDALIGHSDYITPVVIQKIQPFIAIGAAALLLGERPRPGFWWFFLPAVAGFWLVNQTHPLHPSASGSSWSRRPPGRRCCGVSGRCSAAISPVSSSSSTSWPALLLRAARELARAARHACARVLERPR